MQTIHIPNSKFSLELFEEILNKQLPGTYQVVWHQKNHIWDIFVHWDGQRYKDLSKKDLSD